MRTLITGGTGLIGRVTTTALLHRGHRVRLLARHASEALGQWPGGVEAIDGNVCDEAALGPAVAGCEVVLHLAAVARAARGEAEFDEVNVEGTRRLLDAAERAGVRRFVYVSSLGAERGKSPYHRSKFAAEELTRGFSREWAVLRPSNVYGPGDEVVSLLLRMMRVLPAVPAIDGGEHEFQPVWVEDVAEALAQAVERPEVVGRSLDLAGPDRTSMNDLIDRLSAITGRKPARVPVPGFVAVLGARAGSMLGLSTPLDPGQITMLEEGNVIAPGSLNALHDVLGVPPTPLDAGLRKLADALPEQLPGQGVGGLQRRHVWATIEGSKLGPEALFERFRRRFAEITPWHVEVGAEPGTPYELRSGATLTMHLPLRGNVQVRVEELTPLSVSLVTLEGHPLAGVVRFRVEPPDEPRGPLTFHVEVHDRPSNMIDWMMMVTAGGALQVVTWRQTVEHVVKESGGVAPDGVQDESVTLRGDEARRVEAWVASLVERHKRDEHADAVATGELVRPTRS